MAIEIEAKIAVDDFEGVLARLKDAGAKGGLEVLERNLFYDTPEGALKSSDHGLRIRTWRPLKGRAKRRTVITHKGPRAHGKLKSREETELTVDDADAAGELLERLGYMPVFSFEKKRRSFHLMGCAVELDTLPQVGLFVEVEGPGEDAVEMVLKKLGLDRSEMVHASYIAMLSAWAQERRLVGRHVGFDT